MGVGLPVCEEKDQAVVVWAGAVGLPAPPGAACVLSVVARRVRPGVVAAMPCRVAWATGAIADPVVWRTVVTAGAVVVVAVERIEAATCVTVWRIGAVMGLTV
jgi:hypothetical protein